MVSLTIQQERQRIQQLVDLDNQTDIQSRQYYNDCLMFIRNHLSQFYSQYATENGLTVSEVSRKVSRWDLQQWENAVKQMDMSDWPDEAFARVKAYNAQIHIDKKHVMMAVLALGIIQMTVKNQQNVAHRLVLDAQTEAKRMADAFDLSQNKVKQVSSVITKAETRSTWSSNLWIDSDSLANDVENLVNKHLKHGMSLQDMDDILADHANLKQFKPNQSVADRVRQMEYNAQRLVRTESARLVDEVNMATYRMEGVKYVAWVTEPSACIKCIGIALGGPYPIEEAPMIPDDSHPNCRCHKTPTLNQ
ncbi:hypothetical protein [Lentilactobacillus sp. SPB1-3]|uniref:Uncharacterized protein n=1 Tax=Lentilactobacillus terminaliae TaxID=3003483 RepID=A0ACD5DD85_9LACO|nr:hypothetical protein [Lentilactobacillus sp. SPB1-3]MCZ0978033.1 hypothetical protein [Lentilactobacillus sp. SPB1-3]